MGTACSTHGRDKNCMRNIDLREIEWEGVDRIRVSQDKVR